VVTTWGGGAKGVNPKKKNPQKKKHHHPTKKKKQKKTKPPKPVSERKAPPRGGNKGTKKRHEFGLRKNKNWSTAAQGGPQRNQGVGWKEKRSYKREKRIRSPRQQKNLVDFQAGKGRNGRKNTGTRHPSAVKKPILPGTREKNETLSGQNSSLSQRPCWCAGF